MTDGTHADPLHLAELMAARLCHDLSGPVGPMAGMLELAREEPAAAAEALAVVSESTDGLVARIRLLRAAWGGDCGAMDIEAMSALLAAGLAHKRVGLAFSGFAGPAPADARLAPTPADARLAPATARLLLNVLMLGVESLPGGGTVTCARQPDGDIVIRIDGPRAAWPAELALCLADPAAAGRLLQDPRGVQAPFTALLASRPGPLLAMLFAAGPAGAAPPLLLSHRDA